MLINGWGRRGSYLPLKIDAFALKRTVPGASHKGVIQNKVLTSYNQGFCEI
jgi:hypothetical protein